MMDSFLIGINTPSSKNNREWTGSFFIPSDRVTKWRKNTKLQWELQKEAFIEFTKDLPRPLNVVFTFYRKGRHRFDYINPCQTMLDEMKAQGWIPDDNANEIKPFFDDYVYSKNAHGCLIRVLTYKPIL